MAEMVCGENLKCTKCPLEIDVPKKTGQRKNDQVRPSQCFAVLGGTRMACLEKETRGARAARHPVQREGKT